MKDIEGIIKKSGLHYKKLSNIFNTVYVIKGTKNNSSGKNEITYYILNKKPYSEIEEKIDTYKENYAVKTIGSFLSTVPVYKDILDILYRAFNHAEILQNHYEKQGLNIQFKIWKKKKEIYTLLKTFS